MKLKSILPASFAFLFLIALSSFTPENQDEWTDLLDKNLSKWEIYQSYSFKNSFDGKQPKDENGKLIAPVCYNKNEKNVFSVDEVNGEPVLHISGEIYGCVFTKQEFENYQLTLKVKWGDKKWEPRLDKLRDSGLLYHSVGECGVDYWRSWMLSQEFQIMEGHMGDYWGIANSAIDVRAFLPEGAMNTVAGEKQPFLPIGPGTGRDGFCLRSADYESPAGEWTTIELICFGDKSLHIINNQVVMILQNSRFVSEGKSTPLTKGKIQLQSEAGEVFFKDIRIKPIWQIPEKFTHYFN